MSKTSSILDTEQWKSGFGELLDRVAAEQKIDSLDIAKRLDGMAESTGRRRVGDWSRYVNKGRVPTERQVIPLSGALNVPLPVMRVCAGYVDDIFECVYGVVSEGYAPQPWGFRVQAKRVAMALILSLFPGEGAYGGQTSSLFYWMTGYNVLQNLTEEKGFLTGRHWNGTWLYPVRAPKHLVAHHETPDDPNIIHVGEVPKEPWTWYSMRAILQVDLGSRAASRILRGRRAAIPKTDTLYEARAILHRRVLPLALRMDVAAMIVHDWAERVDRRLAEEIREHLHPWNERTITDDAARWIRGEPLEAETVGEDEPRRIRVPGLSLGRMWSRPDPFWS